MNRCSYLPPIAKCLMAVSGVILIPPDYWKALILPLIGTLIASLMISHKAKMDTYINLILHTGALGAWLTVIVFWQQPAPISTFQWTVAIGLSIAATAFLAASAAARAKRKAPA